MAFSNQNPQQDESIADINITPFVDVVLVLLIIFMITAGVVEFGLDIDVPRTREVATTSQDLDFINITANGELYLNDDPIVFGDIVPRVKRSTARRRAFICAPIEPRRGNSSLTSLPNAAPAGLG